jgi:hypothetical protein
VTSTLLNLNILLSILFIPRPGFTSTQKRENYSFYIQYVRMFLSSRDGADWSGGKAGDMYTGGTLFEVLPRHRLS